MESDLDAHAETLDALAAWEGTSTHAATLRARVRSLTAIQGPAPDPAHRALRKAMSCYEQQAPKNLLRFLQKQEADVVSLLSPLLGDPAMGRWLHQDGCQRCSEVEGREYLQLLAGTDCLVDLELQRFALAFFRVRPRVTWMVAARAIAQMAVRTPSLAKTVAQLWARVFPDGLPKRWKPIGEVVPASLGSDRTHLGRHVLYLGCAWLGCGGDPGATPGLDPLELASRKFPPKGFQDSDKSLVLDALAIFVTADETTPALLAQVSRRVTEVVADPQSDRALEALAQELESAAPMLPKAQLRRTILEHLSKPRWQDATGSRRREAAWSWARTQRWMSHCDPQLASGMQTARTTGDVGDACQAIRTLLSDAVRRTSTEDVLLRAYVDAFAMLSMETLADLDWPSLLERATGHRDFQPLLEGRVGETGLVNLAVLLALRGIRVDSVLRDHAAIELERDRASDVALSLAACDDGAVARHAAVQLERLLREPLGSKTMGPHASVNERRAQLNLLWRVLRVDPPEALFTQLLLMLRSPLSLDEPDLYESTTLHELVKAAAHADAVRDAPEELAEALDSLADQAIRFGELEASEDPGFQVIRDLAGFVAQPFEVETFLPDVRAIVGDRSRGLIRWRRWLGHDESDDELLEHVEKLSDALTTALDALPSLDEPTHAELLRAADDLVAATGGLASVEHALFAALVDQLREWGTAQLASGRRAVEVRRRLENALDAADEETCRAITGDPAQLGLLRPDDKRRLNRFLQSHLLLAEARVVQTPTRGDDVAFRSNGEFLRPLVLGAAAGTFFALDVGDPWLNLADAGDFTRLWATVVFGFAASFGLMSWDVARKMQPPRWQAPPQRLLHPFGAATGAALLASVIVATSAGVIDFGTAVGWAKLALWTSLSLFLGVFLHLIVGSGR